MWRRRRRHASAISMTCRTADHNCSHDQVMTGTPMVLSFLLHALLLAGLLIGPQATAQSIEDAMEAYKLEDFATALREFRALAESDDAAAQFHLGQMYHGGEGVPTDLGEAAKWYRLAAEQGHFRAQLQIGHMHMTGEGVPRNDAIAAKWFRLAAEQGQAEAIRWFRFATDPSVTSSQIILGQGYGSGGKIPDNNAEFLERVRHAAELGEPEAQLRLGVIYDFAEGVPEDDAEAVRWYRFAAEQGHVGAQFHLGHMYDFGEGVPEDDAEAVRWYRLAAEQGHVGAQFQLGHMYDFGEGVPEDDAEAVRWYRLAAEQGHVGAQFQLGHMYDFGEGVPEDDAEAVRWYRLATAEGLTTSQLQQILVETELELSSARARNEELFVWFSAERDRSMELETRLSGEEERTLLAQREVEERNVRITDLTQLLGVAENERALAIELGDAQAAQISLLNNQMTALHDRLVSLNEKLEAAEGLTTSQLQQMYVETELELSSARARNEELFVWLSAARDRSMELEARLSDEEERTLLAQREVEERNFRITVLTQLLGVAEDERALAIELGDEQAAQISLLNNQMTALHDRLVSLNETLEAVEGLTTSQLQQMYVETELELSSARARNEELFVWLSAARDRSMELEARLLDEEERTLLAQREIEERSIRIAELTQLLGVTEGERASAIELSDAQTTQIALLNIQMTALDDQLASLNNTLEAAEVKAAQDQVQIAELGERLNAALAAKVQELNRFRSEFLERLHDHLGNREDIKVVGDRFVIQSGVLFPSGSAEISEVGREDLRQIADLIVELIAEIPDDVDWILRVDGHTDTNPISTPEFPSNWELSTARATSVVRYLVSLGVPEHRLMAAGFGEFQPIDAAEGILALQRNRRIEFKLSDP